MAQLVKWPTLDFRSGHDLMACEIQRRGGEGDKLSMEPAWNSFSHHPTPLPPSLPLSLSLSLPSSLSAPLPGSGALSLR